MINDGERDIVPARIFVGVAGEIRDEHHAFLSDHWGKVFIWQAALLEQFIDP